MIYGLQGCKKTTVIGWIAGMLLLAGCTQDKLADASQGEMLPEGKYPVTFTATGLEISAAPRATADGTWETNNEVAIQIGSDVRKYKVATGSSSLSTTLSAADGVTPFYWQSTNETKIVSAWYLGTGYGDGTLPTPWSVQPDQSGNGYQQSDFLYAPQTPIGFEGTNPLTFYHQTAKVVVNIRKYGVVSDASKINSVSIKAITAGTFTTSLTDNCGLSAQLAETPSEITPFKLGSPNTNVVFDNTKSGETALVSYQALVIPQTLGTGTPIEIEIEGYDTFKYTPNKILAGGTQYTYNLTIKGSEVTATVTTDDMKWTNGATGSGSVEIN